MSARIPHCSPGDLPQAPARGSAGARLHVGESLRDSHFRVSERRGYMKTDTAQECRTTLRRRAFCRALLLAITAAQLAANVKAADNSDSRRLLYVAVPGVRNYLEYGGHGLLVFDIDHQHRFVKRIPTAGKDETGKPLNVKGICASATTGRVYISTIKTVTCLDLVTDKVLWERAYEDGCDRMAIAPDGSNLYVPTFEKDSWHVIDGQDGEVLATITPKSGAHNTVYGPDGRRVYLAGLRSPWLTVADTATHTAIGQVGPFSASIRPFTVNGDQTLCFVNINELLGFEVGDLVERTQLHRVEVQGFEKGPVKRHGCPSHGIGMTPDERELWVCDATNQRMHIFDATVMPPKQLTSIKLKDEPGWITFSIDGQYAYPSTGDVIDRTTRKIVHQLIDEHGTAVQSEKMLEIDFQGSKPIRAGDQFGIGGRQRKR